MTTGKEIIVRDALPTSLEEVRGMADAFIKSGMFSDTKSVAQAMVKIQAGRELGLAPIYSMQNINLIRDRLTTSANTMAMLVKRSGKYNYRIASHTDTECKIEFFENGKSVGWSTFTIEDAKRANLIKPDGGWIKFPRAMLFSRAISQGARLFAPDAIGGIYTDEEIRSIPARPEDANTAIVDTTTGEIAEKATTEQAEASTLTSEKSKSEGIAEESHAQLSENIDRLVNKAEMSNLYKLLANNRMELKGLSKWLKEQGLSVPKSVAALSKPVYDKIVAAFDKEALDGQS